MTHQHKRKPPPRRLASKAACKFCGSPHNYGERVGDWHDAGNVFFVVCAFCGAAGPKAETVAEAVTAWEHCAEAIPLAEAEHPHGLDAAAGNGEPEPPRPNNHPNGKAQ